MNAICVFSGKINGTVEFHQCFYEGNNNKINSLTNTKIHFKLSGFEPNTIHGCHIHNYGDLSDGCNSTCKHYNPYNKLHGSIKLYGADRHVVDMCNNIISDDNGNVDFEYYDDLIDLIGNYSVIGRSVVIHDSVDDEGEFRYDGGEIGKLSSTTGNSGGRIACAIIGLTGKNFH